MSLSPALAEVQVAAAPVEDDRLPPPSVDMAGVRVMTDVTYATLHGFRPLRMDIYAVPDAGPRPAVVYVHGGGWTTGNKRNTASYSDFPGLLADLARLGFVVAAVEYRLSGEAPFPAAAQDVKAAIRFLRANADLYGVDAASIAVWGGSAGAHLTGMAAMTCDDPALAPEGNDGVSDCAQAFVGWYGPYDIGAMLERTLAIEASGVEMSAKDRAETEGGLTFFGCADGVCPPDLGTRASPLVFVDPSDPPTLLIHGTADTLVPHAQSEAMEAALRAAGVPVELVLIEGAGHGWAAEDPALRTAASRQAATATFDWLVATLR